ncbi:pyruvate, phosphate dikinase [Rhodobacteraceae bacterium CH30]|nr:pyruvate, phosphate dikinase [Rhodobacteraceae bacterium CH30]
MKIDTQWPQHFYLIAGRTSAQEEKGDISPQGMGAKAYNLREMANLGLPVPPALVIGTTYTANPDACLPLLATYGMPALEVAAGGIFGDERRPLLVSVRSGAPVSMPGMLETLLNVGLCDRTVSGLLRQTGNPRMVWDAYRRLVATFGSVVAGIPAAHFERLTEDVAQGRDERQLDFSEHRALVRSYLDCFLSCTGQDFPQEPQAQLHQAVLAVFRSWHQAKAQAYRKMHGLDDGMGTAVMIQQMVFGNAGLRSGAGVGFTRNPVTGVPGLWFDYLRNAQGEDVVGGRRRALGQEAGMPPECLTQLEEAARLLERHFQDMQDLEFTVEEGCLYLLQTRAGKRSGIARARIALDLQEEGVIDREAALAQTRDLTAGELSHTSLAVKDAPAMQVLARATPASAGVVSAEVVLDADSARRRAAAGAMVVLVRADAETDDIEGLQVAAGLLTCRGARTSHAAVVARQLGKVCLVGCETMQVDLALRELRFGNQVIAEGAYLTLDAEGGQVISGVAELVEEPDLQLLSRLQALRLGAEDAGEGCIRVAGWARVD